MAVASDLLGSRVVFTALAALPIASGAAGVIWIWRLNTLDTLLVIFTAGAVVDVLGVWWGERSRARRWRGTLEGLAKLAGLSGVITAADGDAGTVRVGFEHWDARSVSGQSLRVGQWVTVLGARGRTLLVKPWK